MALVAAFLWNKSPRCSISTMILDESNVKILSYPKISYFPVNFSSFKKNAKKLIKDFFLELISIQQKYKQNIRLEYRILFETDEIPYLEPAKESKFIYKLFMNYLKKNEKKLQHLTVESQLRNKLKGKSLIKFKRELRSLYLVSRKKDTGFEYHLWTIALHATKATYVKKIAQIRKKLIDNIYNEAA